MILVIFHSGCSDGFVAGLIAYEYYLGKSTPFQVLPVNVGSLESEIDKLPDAEILLSFDLTFKRGSYDKAVKKYPKVEIHDHHQTTFDEINGMPGVYFDIKKSGAMLAWNYFNHGFPAPDIVKYVQDRDLWTWKLPNSRAITAWLYDEMGSQFDDGFDKWIIYLHNDGWIVNALTRGLVMLKTVQSNVDQAVKASKVVDFDGKRVVVTNCSSMIYISDIGEALYADPTIDYVLIWSFDHSKGKFRASLRSSADGADVEQVAKKYGGGGHRRASGFVPTIEFMTKLFTM